MRRVLVLLLVLLLAGCGTLFIPSTKEITISSEPVEARVSIDGVEHGLTPISVVLDNKKSHTIVVSKEGYETVSCVLNTKIRGYIIILDVLGGLVPVAVDAVTGGWKTLTSTECSVILPEAQ